MKAAIQKQCNQMYTYLQNTIKQGHKSHILPLDQMHHFLDQKYKGLEGIRGSHWMDQVLKTK